jgi:anthranilate synthase component 1
MHRPPLAEYLQQAAKWRMVPVYRQLLGDTLTPVSAFKKIEAGDWAFLFESVIGGERIGRYSFVGADPFLILQAWDRKVVIEDRRTGRREELTHPDPLKLFEERLGQYRAPHLPGLPRFLGGAVGYAGYDTVRYVERLEHPPTDDRGLPDLSFAFYDRMVIFDHINKTIAVVAHAHVDPAKPERGYEDACRRIDELVKQLEETPVKLPLVDVAVAGKVERAIRSNFEPGGYERAVEKAKEYIRAGDAFQIVVSQRFVTDTKASAFDIYRTLRVVNPSPFLFYLKAGPELGLIGSSPEIMVRVEEDKVTIRPLAGTRRRGKTEEEDKALADELLADPKERAEHIMLVDLGRNDVGRVAKYGTVEISDVMAVERYSHVMHICSNVTGRLRDGLTAFDAMRACLPAGTLSGAPKVRAMEIIDELEPHRRGPYGGAVGYVDFSGNMDTCIALRTIVMKGQTVYLQAGAGLVYDSVPEKEREETENKAMGLLRALELAEKQLAGS